MNIDNISMKKLYLTLIILGLLFINLNLVSAVDPNISIVYPQNLTYSSSVTTFNYTIIAGTNPLDSCFYSLTRGDTNISCGATADITKSVIVHTTFNTNVDGGSYGVVFLANYNFTLINISNFGPEEDGWTISVLTSGDGFLTSSTFVNGNASFNYALVGGTTYKFVISPAAPYQTHKYTGISFPVATELGNFSSYAGGYDGGVRNVYGTTTSTLSEGNYSITGLSSTLGNNTWKIFVNDSTGVLASSEVTFSYIKLVSSLKSPLNNSRININPINFSFNITSPSNITNSTLIIYNINKTIVNSSTTFYDTGIYFVNNYSLISLEDGNYTWEVISFNDLNSSNISSGNFSFQLDATKPFLNITHPQNITYTNNVTNMTFDVNDTHLANCTYSLNGGITNFTVACLASSLTFYSTIVHSLASTNIDGGPYGVKFTPNFNMTLINVSNFASFEDGWAVNILDNASNIIGSSTFVDGNASFNANLTGGILYTIDITPAPTYQTQKYYSFSFPIVTSLGNFSSYAGGYDGGVRNIYVYANYNTANPQITGISSTDGNNTWYVYATDTFNNIARAIINFFVGDIPFTTTVSLLEPDNYYNSTSSTITFSCNATRSGTTVNITNITSFKDGAYRSSTDVSSTLTYVDSGITEGLHNWTCVAYDSNGTTWTTSTRYFNVDTLSPSITIHYPANQTYFNNVTTFNFTVTDANLQACWYSIDGGETNITTACVQNLSLNAIQGNNSWTVSGNDSFGRNSSLTINFYIDLDAPSINLIHPDNNKYFSYNNPSLAYNITSGGIINTTLYIFNLTGLYSETTYPLSQEYYVLINQTMSNLPDGNYSWNVTATDNMSRTSTSPTRNFFIDTIYPHIRTSTPPGMVSGTYNQSYITGAIEAYDINLANATIYLYYYNNTLLNSSTNITPSNGWINYTASFTGLLQGWYIWNASTVDRAGNKNWTNSSVIILLDTIAPNGTVTGPQGGSGGSSGGSGYQYNNSYHTGNFSNSTINNSFAIDLNDNFGVNNVTLNITNKNGTSTTQTVDYAQVIGGGSINVVVGFSQILGDGVYVFFFTVYDFANNVFITDQNTIIVDTIAPNVTLNVTLNNYVYGGTNTVNVTFNWTVQELNANVTCQYEIFDLTDILTIFSPVDVNCSDNRSSALLNSGAYMMVLTVTDIAGNINVAAHNFSVNRLDYSLSTTETKNEAFNLTLYGQDAAPTSTVLTYDGVNYSTTVISFTNRTYRVSRYLDIPSAGTKNFSISGSFGNTGNWQQNVTQILLTLCNATYNVPFLALNFVDEVSFLSINQSLQTFTGTYYTGSSGGTNPKTISFFNASVNPSYEFCFAPGYETITLNGLTIQYSSIDYFLRTWRNASMILSNQSVNNITLYNIHRDIGSYTTIFVADQNGNLLTNATVTLSTIFNLIPFTMTEITDGSGAATFWANPNVAYNVFMDRAGCTSRTVSVRPSLASYTFNLQCENATNVFNFPFVAPYYMNVEGLTWGRGPSVGQIQTGTNMFDFLVRSSTTNISRARMELYNVSGTVLAFIEKNAGEINCTERYCYMNISYTLNNTKILKGRYSVDLGNGYIILENDAQWREINTTIGQPNLLTGLNDITRIFDSVYDDGTLDKEKRSEYSRFVFLFLFMAILLAFFNKVSGYDMANPGAFLIIMTIAVWIGSMAGGLPYCTQDNIPVNYDLHCTGNGFFYYDNLVRENIYLDGEPSMMYSVTAHFVNNYILAFLVSLMLGTYYFSIRRRMT